MSTCASVLLRLLAERGVDRVFGIPGNHTVALYRDLESIGIRHTTCRHEQGAAFMADGYARASGRPGVCLLISGPGLLNAATAIAQARADSVPLLIISAVAATRDLGMHRGRLHELPDQHATSASLCRATYTLLDPAILPELIDRAFTLFQLGRAGPVHIEIPLDLMEAPLAAPAAVERAKSFAPGVSPAALEALIARLDRSQRPLILVGGGAVAAGGAVTALAEMLDAPVLNTVNGKGVCAFGHRLAVGGSPSLPSLRRALAEADAVLALGTELAETDYDLLMVGALEVTGTWMRVDIDPGQLSTPGIRVVADVNAAAIQLAQHIAPRSPGSGGKRAAHLREAISQEPHFHKEIHAFLQTLRGAAEDLVLVGDSTLPIYYAAWQYECAAPRRYFHSVSGFGTLGYALPAAFGARIAGDTAVICLIGDGGIQFTLPELLTGSEAQLAVPVVVWNNEGYREIERSMQARGIPSDSTRIAAPDFVAVATAHRCDYANPRDLGSLHSALVGAFENSRPTLIEVKEVDFLSQPAGHWYPASDTSIP